MTAPPGHAPTPGITGTRPKAELRQATADRIFAAARRANVRVTGAEVRWMMRTYDVPEMTDLDVEALMRSGLVARRRAKVRACDPRRDGMRQR